MTIATEYVKDYYTATLDTTEGTYEVRDAVNWLKLVADIRIADPSSLTDGFCLMEMQLEDGTWVGAQQKVTLRSVDSGTPDVVNANTAAATAIVGGVAENTTGITDIDDAAEITIVVEGCGRPLRLRHDVATSGSATITAYFNGLQLI